MKLLVLLICTAVLAFASAAVVKLDDSTLNEVGVDKSSPIDDINDDIDVFDDDSDDDGNVDDPDDIDDETEIDGVVLKYLTADEIHELLDEEDNILSSEIDIIVSGKIVKQREAGTTIDAAAETAVIKHGRQKRVVGIAARVLFQAGRALFRASRAGRLTRSGSRLTRQYQRPGNFGTANRDFDRFRPDNVRPINGRYSGRTGTVGNHRVTVRDGSSNGRPTLEIRSPRENGSFVRKFRYD